MRLYLTRYLYRLVLACFVVVIPTNLYLGLFEKQLKDTGDSITPWGKDFKNPRVIRMHNVKFHPQLRRTFKNISISQSVANDLLSIKSGIDAGSPSMNLFKQEGIYGPPTYTDIVWPEENSADDRIIAQMQYIPKNVQKEYNKPKGKQKQKMILVWNGLGTTKSGAQRMIADKCPVNTCWLTSEKSAADKADAILYHHRLIRPPGMKRPPGQLWILFLLESPFHTPQLGSFENMVNWTATYRHDSTIVAPYEKFVRYNHSVYTKPLLKNYALGKRKKVAWFVSNCGARNGRHKYAKALGEHIQVDIYGGCGPNKCPRQQASMCFDMLNKQYKFYLAFENSNCRDYITEKFFINGLSHDVIPIVLGAHKDDYIRASPPHSFIHVDDFDSPKELAEYLHKLDTNDDLYNEYFKWKGTGRFVNTYFWCRLCTMVNAANERHSSVYRDINKWWRGDGVCNGDKRWTQATYGKTWS